jgi:hypothetical protein
MLALARTAAAGGDYLCASPCACTRGFNSKHMTTPVYLSLVARERTIPSTGGVRLHSSTKTHFIMKPAAGSHVRRTFGHTKNVTGAIVYGS